MPEQGDRKLTKKEKKALAFRASKGKGKAASAKDAAPSFEDEVAAIDRLGDDGDEDDVQEQAGAAKGKENKKRKRDDDTAAAAAESEAAAATTRGEGTPGDEEQPQKKKKRQRGKTQAQRDREARLAAQGGAGSQNEDGHRKLLFVGKHRFIPSELLSEYAI